MTQEPAVDPGRAAAIAEVVRTQPYLRLLGVELAELRPGYARMRLPVDARLANPYAGLHGGALSSLADTAMAQALRTLIGTEVSITTVELNISYLSGIREGEVVAEAHILRHGRTMAVGDVDLADGDGRLLATARVTYMTTQRAAGEGT